MSVEYIDYEGNELTGGFYHGLGLPGIKDFYHVTKRGEEWFCLSVEGSSFTLNSENSQAAASLVPIPDPIEFEEKLREDIRRLKNETNDLEEIAGFMQRISFSKVEADNLEKITGAIQKISPESGAVPPPVSV